MSSRIYSDPGGLADIRISTSFVSPHSAPGDSPVDGAAVLTDDNGETKIGIFINDDIVLT